MAFELVLSVVFLLLVLIFTLIWLFVENPHISFVGLAVMLIMMASGFLILGEEFSTTEKPLLSIVFLGYPVAIGLFFLLGILYYAYTLINPNINSITAGRSRMQEQREEFMQRKI